MLNISSSSINSEIKQYIYSLQTNPANILKINNLKKVLFIYLGKVFNYIEFKFSKTSNRANILRMIMHRILISLLILDDITYVIGSENSFVNDELLSIILIAASTESSPLMLKL